MIKTKVIVLHKTHWKESSLLVKVLSVDVGVLDCIVQGARKPKSAYFSHFEMGNCLEVVLQKRGTANLYKVTDSSLVRSSETQSYLQLLSVQVGLETFGQLVVSDEESEDVFALLYNYLDYMPAVKSNHHLVIWRMLIRLVDILGFPVVYMKDGEYRLVENGGNCNKYVIGYDSTTPDPTNLGGSYLSECLAILPNVSRYVDKPVVLRESLRAMDRFLYEWLSVHLHKKIKRNALDMYEEMVLYAESAFR
jgi:hypothetical protein